MSNPWEIQTIEYDKTNAEGNVEASGYGQISILLNKYVLKEKGKGLSSNDFTDNDVQKLKSIEVGAETNKLETLTINGGTKIYPNDEKNINLPIPTKVSQLDNDLGYAKLINMSHDDNFSDSYVGKAKFAFQEEENIAIGKNSNVEYGGIAIGKNTATSETYDINIGNELLHNKISDIWEGKISSSLSADVAMKNTNGTNLTQLDVVIEDLATETQNRIDADGVLQDNIDTETRNRINADETLQDNIDAEITNRNDADMMLQNNINAETQNRIDADNSLSNDIGTEASIRQNADDLLASDISNVSSRITSIEDKIPSQASSSNQLADKSFVNSSIQTNTANFRGNWNTWSDVPSDNVDLYPQDYAGSRIPTVNDYLVVENASDYTANTLSGTWRFKYSGVWETDGKNGWIPEYQVNEEPLTSEQVYAINSGITSDKVSSYDAHLIDTSNPHSVTKSQVGLGDVINSGDSAIPIEGGTTKFTTGGAYTELAKKVDKVEGKGLSTNDFTDTYKNKLDNAVTIDYDKLMKLIYPVGSLYWSSKSTNPASLFGGTWVQIKDRFVLACGDTYNITGATGGSATVQLTESNLPAHTHGMNHHHYTSGTTGDNNRGHTHKFTPSGSVSSSFSGITHEIQIGDPRSGFFTDSTNTTAGSKIRWTYGTTGSWDTSALSDSVSWTDGGSVSSSFSGTKSNTEDVSQNHTHTWGDWSGDSCTIANNSTARSNTDSTGSGTSFSVLPPYVVKYCWERTA